MTREAFAASVEEFIRRTGITATSFGKRALGDPTFVFELRRGRDPSLGVVARAQAFMSEHDRKSEAAA